MTLSSEIKAILTTNVDLMAVLTGGIFIDVEAISPQKTPSAYDSSKEIKPCALIKIPNETPAGPYKTSVRTTIIVYLYQRSGYDKIASAMVYIYGELNEKKIGTNVWNIEHVNSVHQQQDQALNCPLGLLRFSAVRQL